MRIFWAMMFVVPMAVACGPMDGKDTSDTDTDAPADTDAGDPTDGGDDTDGGDAGDDTDMGDTDATGGTDESSEWGKVCTGDADCGAPTDYCVMAPGYTEGYCSMQCANNAACLDAGAPADTWTCNAVFSCDDLANTWCGPNSEIEESGGFIIECE